jgi:hypothetical protein
MPAALLNVPSSIWRFRVGESVIAMGPPQAGSVRGVVAVRRGRREDTVRCLQAGGGQPAVWHLARGEPEAAWRGDERGDVVAP